MEDLLHFKDADYFDKNQIFEQTNNIDKIKKFFNGNIDFSYENDRFHVGNGDNVAPQMEITSKYLIIFTEKAGSSIIVSTLEKYDLVESSLKDKSGYTNYYFSKIIPHSNLKNQDKFEEIDKIINGVSKKDIVLVTRNPVYKFLSGIYQDISGELENSNILFETIQSEFGRVYYNDNNKNLDKIKSINEEQLVFLAYNLLNHRLHSSLPIAYSHSKLHNQHYYLLLTRNSIDISKLKIIDIDDPACDLLQCMMDYNPEITQDIKQQSFWTHRSYHGILLDGIYEMCIKHNNIILLEKIKSEIKNDFYYYTILRETFKNNIYIK